MGSDELFARYQELQRYVGWTDDDAQRVRTLAPLLEPCFPQLVDDFYEEIDRHPDARQWITGGPEQIVRLKVALRAWLHDLVTGPYDADYVLSRWQVGLRHAEIGVSQVFTNVALSRLRRGLSEKCGQWAVGSGQWPVASGQQEPEPSSSLATGHPTLATDSPGHRTLAMQSLNVLLDLDLAIIEDAYQTENTRRLQLSERLAASERLLQGERLAGIGQMMTGLAHESGNALARTQSCLEMLAWEVEDRPAALDLITRIQKAQDDLRQLYEDVRSYATPLRLDREAWSLAGVWRQAWENLAMRRQGRDAAIDEVLDSVNLTCSVDPFRLEQVFRNILENSLAACADPMRVTIHTAECMLENRPAVRMSVRDNGPGLNAEQRARIFDPFFTTKTKGTGLGMAIAKRIVDAHGGVIEVGPGPGAEIVIILPRESP